MRIAGAWSWRILVIAGAAAVVVWALSKVTLVVIPLLVAALIASLLLPLVERLRAHRWPRALAVAVTLVGLIGVVSGLLWLSIAQIRSGYPDLQAKALVFWVNLKQWLLESPLHVNDADLTLIGEEITNAIRKDAQAIVTSALSVGSTFGHVLAGLLLALFSALFLMLDGARIWAWIVALFPTASRPAIDGSGRAGWATLGNFMRVQVIVAAIDAIGIGIGAALLGLPLTLPIAILVFLGSFVPVVGAVVTGALAVCVALVALGPWQALIMLGIVLLVQQVESHVLQPLIMGTAVQLHPLGVVLAVTAGSIIAGVPGALFAVPLTAFANMFISTIASGSWRTPPDTAHQA